MSLRSPRPALIVLAILVAAGLALRAWAFAAQYPASWTAWDSTAYLDAAREGVFDNYFRPAGYPALLRVLHDVWPSVAFVVAVQHLLGVLTGVLAYLTCRRLGLPWVLALMPAAVVLLNGDQISIEHGMLSESIFTPLLFGTLYALVRSLDAEHVARWLVLAGTLAAAMVTVRVAALGLIPVLAAAAALAPPRGWWPSLQRAALAGGTAVVLVVAYAGLAAALTGHFAITRASGWAVYARTASFADCRQFTPPKGTERLCETNDARRRPGPDFYLWQPGSPAWKAFGGPPNGSEDVGAFGRTVILHQPLTYGRYVAGDVWRNVNSAANIRGTFFGTGPDSLLFDQRAPEVEQYTERQVTRWYGAEPLRVRSSSLGALADYQDVVRLHGGLVGALFVLSLIGVVTTRGRTRWGVAAFAAFAFVVILVPAASMVYHARYGVPMAGILCVAGILGAQGLAARFPVRRAPRASAAAAVR